jgi:hypothetical protein
MYLSSLGKSILRKRSALHPTFHKAGTQSHKVCPADSLAAEESTFGGFFYPIIL